MAALDFLSQLSCLPALGARPWCTSLTQPGLSLLLSLTSPLGTLSDPVLLWHCWGFAANFSVCFHKFLERDV